MKVAIFGARGFVGKALMLYLKGRGIETVLFSRQESIVQGQRCIVTDYSDIKKMQSQLLGIDVVVHSAGLAHQVEGSYTLQEYIEANVNITKAIAESAKKANVNRFIYISSIAVNGNSTEKGKVYSESDLPSPVSDYGKTKYMAEKVIRNIFENSNTDYVILRPPLIYGPTCPGNFRKLLVITSKIFILPLGGVKNKRTFIYIDNITDAIFHILSLPDAANEIFIVSDKDTYPINEIVEIMLQEKFGNKAINLYIPPAILKVLSKVFGFYNMWCKFSAELVVDSHKLTSKLKWQPPFTALEGIKKTTAGYNLDA
jgi:nucleoside-diphosphate-sugar epimerase